MKHVKIQEINPYVRFAKLQYQGIHFSNKSNPLTSIAPDWRLFYVEKGRCGIMIDDEPIIVGNNMVIIIPPKTPYSFFKPTNSDGNSTTILLYILNFDLFINEKNSRISPLSPLLKETHDMERFEDVFLNEFSPFFIGHLTAKVRDYLDDLKVKKSLEQNEVDIATCSCLLKLALIELLKTSNDNTTEDIISAITTYVASNIGKNFTIKQMASDLFFHPFYISKVFKNAMHISLHEYILSERLLHSKYLLENTSDSIEKITTNSGFVNVSHFCKQFYKHFSISPLKYRKSLPNTENNVKND